MRFNTLKKTIHKVKMTTQFRVTIPKAIRAELGLKPGDIIKFESDGHVINCIPTHKISQRKK